MAHERVRLKDIAQVYGCSINTVSKALHDSEELPESTRNKIKQLAKEMGYIQNRQASSLRSGRSHIVAVIVYDIQNAYFSALISEMELSLRQAGYDALILCSQTSITEKEHGIEMIQVALSLSVDGIIYFPYWTDYKTIQFLNKSHVPFVLVSHWLPEVNVDIVRCDDYQGGRLAAAHLVSLGHRKFVYIAGPVNNSAQYDREKGFREVLYSAGVKPEDIYLISSEQWEETNANGDIITLLQPQTYKAIFAFNDNVAYQIMVEFRKAGIRVPEDISLIGCDHIARTIHYLDSLTSVACDDKYSLARESVQVLLNRIQEPEIPPVTRILPVRLYDGNTTRKPEMM